MNSEENHLKEPATPYTAEPQVELRIPLSTLLKAVESLGENSLHLLQQWIDKRLSTLSIEVGIREGTPGRKLTRFAGWIPTDDLTLMQEAIESGCERVDVDE